VILALTGKETFKNKRSLLIQKPAAALVKAYFCQILSTFLNLSHETVPLRRTTASISRCCSTLIGCRVDWIIQATWVNILDATLGTGHSGQAFEEIRDSMIRVDNVHCTLSTLIRNIVQWLSALFRERYIVIGCTQASLGHRVIAHRTEGSQ
jgi:hypothetical protein